MDINQKIYKAIQKGLNEALTNLSIDDFNDVEIGAENSVEYNDIDVHSGSKEYEDWKWIKENFVDLGLPSRTLWCKWNIGATCEENKESWYGDYYVWGSTTPADVIGMTLGDVAALSQSDNVTVTDKSIFDEKYFKNHIHEFVGTNGDLFPEYDSVYQIDHRMCMPSKEQLFELCSLPNKWKQNYNNIPGLNGTEFVGKNGNTLFIPAAGFQRGQGICGIGKECNVWSKTFNLLSTSIFNDNPFSVCCDSDGVNPNEVYHKTNGYPLRGIANKH